MEAALTVWVQKTMQDLFKTSESIRFVRYNDGEFIAIRNLPGNVEQDMDHLCQFGLAQLVQGNQLTPTSSAFVCIPGGAARQGGVEHTEEWLIGELQTALPHAPRNPICILYTQNFPCRARQGGRAPCYNMLLDFARRNPNVQCYVLYQQPWPQTDTLANITEFIRAQQLPANIRFASVAFDINWQTRQFHARGHVVLQ